MQDLVCGHPYGVDIPQQQLADVKQVLALPSFDLMGAWILTPRLLTLHDMLWGCCVDVAESPA